MSPFALRLRPVAAVAVALIAALLASIVGIRAAAAFPTDRFTVTSFDAMEGTGGTTTFIFRINRNGTTGTNQVRFWTTDGTATDGNEPGEDADYTPVDQTVTFSSGQTQRTVTVSVIADDVREADQVFNVHVDPAQATPPGDGTCSTCDGTGTIRNDDEFSSELFAGNYSAPEGNTGSAPTTSFTFNVDLDPPSATTVTVHYKTADGTAVAGSDYVAQEDDLTFEPGETRQTVTVPVIGDTINEPAETFFLDLSAPSEARIRDSRGDGTIQNDDPQPGLSIADHTDTEGNVGNKNFPFVVTLTPESGQTVTVAYTTSNGTATQPSDYSTTSGTLTFLPGQTSQTINVPVVGDFTVEPNETFTVTLSAPTNATLTRSTATGNITNDDSPAPAATIDDASVAEGNSGTVTMFFTVSKPASTQSAVVHYETQDNTATAPEDYVAENGDITFAANETSKQISITVNGDTVAEANETFKVLLTAVSGFVTVAPGEEGIGTINNDDATAPTVSINDAPVTEGAQGTTTPATFTVTLSAAPAAGFPVVVDYATQDGTAIAGADYVTKSGSVTFISTDPLTKTIPVNVSGDNVDEANETFTVVLSRPRNASLADGSGLGTINDDDADPAFTINDQSVTEGDTGTVDAVFTVTNPNATSRTVTLDFTTQPGTASAGSDYTTTNGVLTFEPGVTTQTITVPVKGDGFNEPTETFTVVLSNPSFGSLADDTGTGTITNDDAAPTLTVDSVTVPEGNAGTVNAVFTVTKTGSTDEVITANFATADGSATAPGDYTSNSGVLTFAQDETEKTITVVVKADTIDEANENFTVVLSGVTNATAGAPGTGTITDDDASPVISINNVTVFNEGNVGTTNATFTLTKSGATEQTVTVDYATANGTAVAPGDFTAASGTVSIAPGESSKPLTIAVKGDTVDEANETFTVSLSNPVRASTSNGTGTATINDDDDPAAEPQPDPQPTSSGYWMVGSTGDVFSFGDAQYFGGAPSTRPIVDIEPTPDNNGYWIVDEVGNVHTRGNAANFGGNPTLGVGEKVTSLSKEPSGTGYWLFTNRGRVVAYGTAVHLGDMSGTTLNGPVLDSIPTPSGNGYYMVASDGGIFTFGDADFHGSMGGIPLNQPVQSLVPDPDGKGYWLVASDGGIFAFESEFYGSMGAVKLNKPVTGMVGARAGYLMVGEDGGIFTFGDAVFHGSLGSSPPARPIVSVASF